MKRRQLLETAAAAIAAAALSPLPFTRPGNATAVPRRHRVEISSFRFTPDKLEVSAGDSITWVNQDIAPHTATAVDGSWNTGELVKDAEASITVAAGMEAMYFCAFHPMMKAHISIIPADQ